MIGTDEKTNIVKNTQVTEMSDVAESEVKTRDAKAITANADELHETAEDQKLLVARNKVAARTAIKRANQPGLSDPLVGPGTSNMSPGAMQMSAVVKFHSTQSINLFRGRKGDPANGVRPIIGLARFARQVSLVWSAAAIDDPYADQVLLDIENAYDAAKATLESKEQAMKGLLEGMEDFEVTLQASIDPVEIKLQFYSPWGFRAAMLLKQFDKLVRMALTARHIGIFTESDWLSIVRESARALRHMFNEVDGWVSTGVKREDLRNNTAVAKRAQNRYLEVKKRILVVDQAVIDGSYRAKLSPVNRILEKYLGDVATTRAILKDIKLASGSPENVNKSNEADAVQSKPAPNFGFSVANKHGDKATVRNESESETEGGDKHKAKATAAKKMGGK
jgi:integrating conjugative element protein (TIGR03761 family)